MLEYIKTMHGTMNVKKSCKVYLRVFWALYPVCVVTFKIHSFFYLWDLVLAYCKLMAV